jgi:hypothetical protein
MARPATVRIMPTTAPAPPIVLTGTGQDRRVEALGLLGARSPLSQLDGQQQESLRELLAAVLPKSE